MLREDFLKLKRGDRVLISQQADNVTEFHRLAVVNNIDGGRVFFKEWPGGGFDATPDAEIIDRMAVLPNLIKLVGDITELNDIARSAVAALNDNEHFAELGKRYERCVSGFENVRLYLPGL